MKVFLAILCILEKIFRVSCEHELSIILSLIKNLEIRQCFFVNDSFSPLSEKKLLLKNVATAYISYEILINYLEETKNGEDGTGIILQDKSLARVEELSQKLDLVIAEFENEKKIKNLNFAISSYLKGKPNLQNEPIYLDYYSTKFRINI